MTVDVDDQELDKEDGACVCVCVCVCACVRACVRVRAYVRACARARAADARIYIHTACVRPCHSPYAHAMAWCVTMASGVFYLFIFSQADRLVVTLPNNILRDGDVVFKPPLSADKVYSLTHTYTHTYTLTHTHRHQACANTHTHTNTHTHVKVSAVFYVRWHSHLLFFWTFLCICILASD